MRKLTEKANKLVDSKRPTDVTVAPGSGGETSTTGLVPQVLRALSFARSHGWGGGVNSGFRSRAEQEVLYARYLAGGTLAAKPGTSNHELGQAVDVSDAGSFGAAMSRAPANSRLIAGIPSEPWHYSVTGNAKGGRLPFGGWYGRGGELRVNGATMIGVGESGAENVSIRPAGKGGGGGMQVKIDIGNIHYSGKGEIKEAIKREVSSAFSELSSELDLGGNSGVMA